MTMLLSSVASNATRVPIARGIDDLGQVALEAANRRARDDRGGTFARCAHSLISLVAQLADCVESALERDGVELRERQAREPGNAPVQLDISLHESLALLRVGALDGGRVRDAPVGAYRLAGPDRADFTGCVVAHGKYEVELGSAR